MTSISKFYSGRSIFITGGTGFIGKQIVEKLLRSCSEIDRIYLLMRPKKGVALEDRITQTLASPVFDRLRHAQPDFRRKLSPIGGDVSNDLLGISDRDRTTLEKNVSLVIHSAATLNMMEPLKEAVNMNLLGVRRMLTLCKQLPSLEGLVHLSTAFTQVDQKTRIEERLYEPPLSPSRLIDMTNTLTTEELAELTPYLLRKHDRPNTYTLTKAVAERLIVEERGDIPMSIFRPSIVGASLNEPMPGWLENYTGLTGIYTGIGTGFIRTVLTEDPVCIDVIPVDLTANAVIAVMWKTATSKQNSDIPIYHYTSGVLNYCSIAQYRLMILENCVKAPFTKIPGKRSVWLTPKMYIHQYYLKVWLPLKFETADKVLQLMGKKPMFVKMHNISKKTQSVLDFFTSHEWRWDNDNVIKIQEDMTEADKKEFNIDIKTLDWHDYFEKYWYGIKKYLFKVPEEELIWTPTTAQDIVPKSNLRRAFYSSVVLVSLMTPYYMLI